MQHPCLLHTSRVEVISTRKSTCCGVDGNMWLDGLVLSSCVSCKRAKCIAFAGMLCCCHPLHAGFCVFPGKTRDGAHIGCSGNTQERMRDKKLPMGEVVGCI